ncbi:TetR/AcrR family transcriptional regulator [Streptosporangium minutum]|uniref:HTH tetR-type domain-containing protein n=1 Tax=Streptosporangium minutum TaxID=569862 RepID=A0A243RVK2_9ACTN|nr:TetR/AcrR family transcriptional regulator [Streptosporangium minutum]OUC99220.1 hypothetical protein CA984_04055 [Streptosporangium minutum]
MSPVSSAHLAARRAQLLKAARTCFARNGFHATSMQEVLSEARMSPGGAYRYFPSKEALVAAIATETLTEVSAALKALSEDGSTPGPDDMVTAVTSTVERLDALHDTAKLEIQVWAEAQRSPLLAEQFARAFADVERFMTEQVETYQGRGLIERDVPAGHIARVLIGLVHGFMVQRTLLQADTALFRDGLRALVAGPGRAPAPPSE